MLRWLIILTCALSFVQCTKKKKGSDTSAPVVIVISDTATNTDLSFSAAVLDLGNAFVGAASVQASLRLTNGGSGPATGCEYSITGNSAFSIGSETGQCTSRILAGSTCSVPVKGTAADLGAVSATLAVACDGGFHASTSADGVTMTGVHANIEISSSTSDLGTAEVDGLGTPVVFTFENKAGANVGDAADCYVILSGNNVSSFALITNSATCSYDSDVPAALAVGASCTAKVAAAPSQTGDLKTNLVMICANAADVTKTVTAFGKAASLALTESVPENLTVEPVYQTGTDWNSYITDSAPSQPRWNQSDQPCRESEIANCFQGAIYRKVVVPRKSSCSDLEGSDSLDAFIWSCRVVGGTATFFSTDFKPGKGLVDLVDSAGFIEMRFGLHDRDADKRITSVARKWWINPVVTLDPGPRVLNASGTIYRVAYPHRSFAIAADHIALVVPSGITVESKQPWLVYGGKRTGLWIEGAFDGSNNATTGLLLPGLRYSRVQNVALKNVTGSGVDLGTGSRSVTLDNLNIIGNSNAFKYVSIDGEDAPIAQSEIGDDGATLTIQFYETSDATVQSSE